MIPPPSPILLLQNPQFAVLHKTLTTKHLDTDASTRSVNAAHEPTIKTLHSHRVRIAKQRILLATLQSLAQPSPTISTAATRSNLSSEQLTLLSLITSYIAFSPTLTASAHDLLTSSLQQFHTLLPSILPFLTTHLQSLHTRLTNTTSTTVSALSQPTIPPIPDLQSSQRDDFPALIAHLTTHLSHLSHLLPLEIHSATTTLTSLLSAQSLALQTTIREIEHATGPQARHLLARAAFLRAVAEGLRGKGRVRVLEAERDAVDTEGLERRVGVLAREIEERRGRKEVLVGVMGEYEALEDGERVLRVLGTRYGEIEAETQSVREDIERLRSERGVEPRRDDGGGRRGR